MGSEYLRRRRLHSLSEQTVLALCHCHSKAVLPQKLSWLVILFLAALIQWQILKITKYYVGWDFNIYWQFSCVLSSCYFLPLYKHLFSSLLTKLQIFCCLLLNSIADLFVYIFEFCVKSLTYDKKLRVCFFYRAHQFSINHTNLPK